MEQIFNNSYNKINKMLYYKSRREYLNKSILTLNNIEKNLIDTYNYPNTMDILDDFNTRIKMDQYFGLEQSTIIRDLGRQITRFGYAGSVQWLADINNLFSQQVIVQKSILDKIQESHNLITNFPVRTTSIASSDSDKKSAAAAAATLCAKLNSNMISLSNTKALLLDDPSYSTQIATIDTFGFAAADISKNVQVSKDGIAFLKAENITETLGTTLESLQSGDLASKTLWYLLVDSFDFNSENRYWIIDNYKFSDNMDNSNIDPLNYFVKNPQPSWCFSRNESSTPVEVKKMEIILNSPEEIEKFSFNYVPDKVLVQVNSSNVRDDIWDIISEQDKQKFEKIKNELGEIEAKKTLIRITTNNRLLKVDEFKLAEFKIHKTIDQNLVILNTIQNFSIDWNKFQLEKLTSESNIIISKVNRLKKQIQDLITNKSQSFQQELDDIGLDILATSTQII